MQSFSTFTEPAIGRGAMGSEHAIAIDDAVVEGTLTVPVGARALVVVLHASSAGRFEPGARFLGEVLQQAAFATFQLDLLTPAENSCLPLEKHRTQDTLLMVTRTLAAIDWLKNQPTTNRLSIGLFASTPETVAALITAERATGVRAVVSDGGCPDYFDDTLTRLRVPTLLIVGRQERARAPELASEFFARHLLT